jgi:radical SAM-linked protein
MLGDKLRFRFAKTGTLRLLSHHDLMRCFERMLRRAELPFKSTAGFHPTPRVVFALSLPLGVAGLDEVVEIEFTRPLEADEVLARLKAQAPAGLEFTGVSVVPLKATATPRRVLYRLALPPGRAAAVAERCAELMAEPKVWVDRLRPGPKRLNIRPYFRNLSVVSGGQRTEDGGQKSDQNPAAGLSDLCPLSSDLCEVLCADLWVTQTGTARADELLKLLGAADLPDAGAVVARTTVELRDEVVAGDPTDQPPDGPADTLPLDSAAIAALSQPEEEQPAAAGWGLSPAGPVVE